MWRFTTSLCLIRQQMKYLLRLDGWLDNLSRDSLTCGQESGERGVELPTLGFVGNYPITGKKTLENNYANKCENNHVSSPNDQIMLFFVSFLCHAYDWITFNCFGHTSFFYMHGWRQLLFVIYVITIFFICTVVYTINRLLVLLQCSVDWLIIFGPICKSVSPPTFRGVTWEEVRVCACSPNFLNDLSGCSRAISGLASQTESCRPSLFTLHIHPHKQSHRLPLGSHRAWAPHQALGSVITEKFAFSPHPYPPCSLSSSSPLPPSGYLLL